jgi:hypothetical protein
MQVLQTDFIICIQEVQRYEPPLEKQKQIIIGKGKVHPRTGHEGPEGE